MKGEENHEFNLYLLVSFSRLPVLCLHVEKAIFIYLPGKT